MPATSGAKTRFALLRGHDASLMAVTQKRVRGGNNVSIPAELGTGPVAKRFQRDQGIRPWSRQLVKGRKKQMSAGKMTVAAATFASLALLSVGWSEPRGVSLMTSAQADEGYAAAPKKVVARKVAANPHRRHWRSAHGYASNPVAAGAGLAAGAVDTAGAVAAGAIGTAGAIATAPFGGPYAYAGPRPYAGSPGWGGYYASSGWGDYECSPGSPGCRPYASKDWRTP
jgi:hypothetical protein